STDDLLKAVLRLDPLEAGTFVKRVRPIARDARTHAKHLTTVLGGPQRGADSAAPLPFGDDEAENFRRAVRLEIWMRADMHPADDGGPVVGDEQRLVVAAVDARETARNVLGLRGVTQLRDQGCDTIDVKDLHRSNSHGDAQLLASAFA